jgi:hypothetical protein
MTSRGASAWLACTAGLAWKYSRLRSRRRTARTLSGGAGSRPALAGDDHFLALLNEMKQLEQVRLGLFQSRRHIAI